MQEFKKLMDVKSIVTLLMTLTLVLLLMTGKAVNHEFLTLFSSSYGAVVTYFFTKKPSGEEG